MVRIVLTKLSTCGIIKGDIYKKKKKDIAAQKDLTSLKFSRWARLLKNYLLSAAAQYYETTKKRPGD